MPIGTAKKLNDVVTSSNIGCNVDFTFETNPPIAINAWIKEFQYHCLSGLPINGLKGH